MQAADWNQPDKHQTRIIADEKDQALIRRELADYAFFDKRTSRYVLEPPVITWQTGTTGSDKTCHVIYPATVVCSMRLH